MAEFDPVEERSGRSAKRSPRLIILPAAIVVSLLAALSMIEIAALTGSLAWSVIGTVVAAILVSWVLGFGLWRREPSRRVVLGPIIVLGAPLC
jgi:Flp pilus assembly protein TadB